MNNSPDTRILHVAETIIGGVSSYLQEIVSFQQDVFGPENVRVLVPANHASEIAGIDDRLIIRFSRTGRNLRSLVAFSLALNQAVERFRPTIVHLHSTFAGAVARPLLQAARERPYVVYCPHGWAFLMDVPPWKRQAYALIERGLSPLTDVVVNISRHEDAQAKRYGIPAEKCVVVRNAVSPASVPALADSPFDEQYINLLFVGRFDRQKGLDLLLHAMSRLRDAPIRLHVIGGCVNEAKAVAAPENVQLLGWLPRQALDAYYAAADALVVPSRWEGFGLVAIEAMRNATAVIASDRGALPELVQDGENGCLFTLDGNADDLVRVLRSLDKQRLSEMGRNAALHYDQHFTADVMNRSLLDVYGKLQQQPARAKPMLQWSRGNLF